MPWQPVDECYISCLIGSLAQQQIKWVLLKIIRPSNKLTKPKISWRSFSNLTRLILVLRYLVISLLPSWYRLLLFLVLRAGQIWLESDGHCLSFFNFVTARNSVSAKRLTKHKTQCSCTRWYAIIRNSSSHFTQVRITQIKYLWCVVRALSTLCLPFRISTGCHAKVSVAIHITVAAVHIMHISVTSADHTKPESWLVHSSSFREGYYEPYHPFAMWRDGMAHISF